MAEPMIAALALILLAPAQAPEQKTALVLFDMPKEVAIAARAKLVSKLAAANHPLAGIEQTRALFPEPREIYKLSAAKIEEVRTSAGLDKLIIVDSAVPPKDGLAVYRIRIFAGDEPQLRFQATAGADEPSAEVLSDSVLQLIEDFARGRSAAH